jgi:hypothetical protein
MKAKRLLIPLVLLAGIVGLTPWRVAGWGPKGHEMAGRAAAIKLPEEMPRFFRKAADQLAYLSPEPDRWRDRVEFDLDKGMSQSAAADHFIDLELAQKGTMTTLVNRYDFAAEVIKSGKKPTEVGFLPYRILELFQRVRVEFRLWRAEHDEKRKGWIEERIINDAGILAHYAEDASNPHHATVNYNGWAGPNPKGYTVYSRDHGFHARFEDEYVATHIELADILPRIAPAKAFEKPRDEIWAFLERSNSLVEQLYILDKQEPFGEATRSADHKTFAVARLAEGSGFVRDLWWTAWLTSGSTGH